MQGHHVVCSWIGADLLASNGAKCRLSLAGVRKWRFRRPIFSVRRREKFGDDTGMG